MRILIVILFVFFSSSVFSENISDLDIEGMSIEDSLLKFYSKSEIRNAPNYNDLPSDMKFTIIEMPQKGEYEFFQFFFKTNDSNFKIAYIAGANLISIDECVEEQKDIINDISQSLSNVNFSGPKKLVHPDDPSGDSYSIQYISTLDGGSMLIECYSYSNQVHWQDHLRISIVNNEAAKWTDSNYGVN